MGVNLLMAEFESIVDYSTKLDNFEGPLDLLLHLIKEAKIEIINDVVRMNASVEQLKALSAFLKTLK